MKKNNHFTLRVQGFESDAKRCTLSTKGGCLILAVKCEYNGFVSLAISTKGLTRPLPQRGEIISDKKAACLAGCYLFLSFITGKSSASNYKRSEAARIKSIKKPHPTSKKRKIQRNMSWMLTSQPVQLPCSSKETGIITKPSLLSQNGGCLEGRKLYE